jgi:hypothetical protein
MENIADIIKQPKKGKPISERAYWVSQLQELTEIPLRPLLFKWLSHIPKGSGGTEILRVIYLDSLKVSGRKNQRYKCWELIKESKIIKIDEPK